MRIVVNDIAACKGGAMTVLKDFYFCVCENDKQNEWIFLLGDKYFEETQNVKIIAMPQIKQNPLKKVMFDFFTGKRFINSLKPDVVFSMQNIITFGVKQKQILYLHQSIPFQKVKRFSFFKAKERKIAFIQFVIGAMIKRSVKKANGVIVQTEWMRDAVCKKCRINGQKVINILPNVNDIMDKKDESLFDNRTFFYPTAKAIYKNNDCVFSACELLDRKNLDYSVTLTLPKEFSRDKINCIGRIPYDDVIRFYNQSTLVFPSYIETFGYPLAEARMLGALILASDCPFSREVLSGYENAYFFNPFNPEELGILMEKVIKGEIKRAESTQLLQKKENNWIKVLNTVLGVENENP